MLPGAFIVLCVGSLMIDHVTGLGPDEDGQSSKIDGLSVLNMGRKNNNPLLRLIGTAMRNSKQDILEIMRNSKQDILEIMCPFIRCGEWSVWSACPAAVRGQFGMITRSRECGRSHAFCKRNASQKVYQDTDSRVCMVDNCPIGFNETENGFCFLVHEMKMKWAAADELCREKGAFLVDVSSKLKNDDLYSFVSKNCTSCINFLWIDGRRKDGNSPWEYSYKHARGPRSYSNWSANQPDNRVDELYIGLDMGDGKLRDLDSHFMYPFVCEYIK